MRTGSINLPLHYGKCPAWLFRRMVKLGRALVEVMLIESGRDEVLRRLTNPFWFQSLGCIMGFDWHSSGLTTTVCGALKEALRDECGDLGIYICGGKGASSRRTPDEIISYVDRYALSLDAQRLVYASRMSAKVDNTALQDGYQLYHHTFIFTADGKWAVIQQGMNEVRRRARRYHWLGDRVTDFVCEPQAAICTEAKEENVLNLVARESAGARDMSASLAREKPDRLVKELRKIQDRPDDLFLTSRHTLVLGDLHPDSVKRVLLKTYERQPAGFEDLLAIKGVGPKAIRALSLLAELSFGMKPSYRDPAKFSFAHGGKDGYPSPVDRKTYDHSIEYLEKAIKLSKLGNQAKLQAFKRLALIR
ncbi:MAG: DUF763 domain-containing protein [Peptococcaceae bacterium]|nr:DUF763 domain-containing protein [Peptococcaceae bacterium]